MVFREERAYAQTPHGSIRSFFRVDFSECKFYTDDMIKRAPVPIVDGRLRENLRIPPDRTHAGVAPDKENPMKKRILSLCLALLMCAALLPASVRAASADTSGRCGETLYWSFDLSTGTLTITGKGDMWNYDFDDGGTPPPWYEHHSANGAYVNYHNDIRTVLLPEGLTGIGSCAFDGCGNLQSITVPRSLKSVGLCAFNCCGVTDVYYGGTESMKQNIAVREYAYGTDYNAPFLNATWHYAPEIKTQPQSQTVALGEELTIKVVAAGTGLTYQWQYSKNNGASWTNWSGKTKSSVTFKGSTTNNGVLYRCVVKNASGSATSGAAKLTVSGVKPSIRTQPQSLTVILGEELTFKVVAAGTGLTYQWQYSKNNGASWTNWSGKTKSSVTFKGSTTNNGVLYRCVVKNASGSATSGAAKLTVNQLTITEQPTAQKGAVGTPVTFRVKAAGTGLTYQWQYSNDAGKTWKNCASTGYNKASFSFKTNRSVDGRLYRCVVSSGSSSIASDAAKLTVPLYSAILVGEENYQSGYLPGPLHDLCAMKGMLSNLRASYAIKSLPDATRSQILSEISALAKNSKSYDVLWFYYSGHGTDAELDNTYQGALCTVEGNIITMKELAAALSQYKGRVIVLLDSCFSGAAISKSAGGADEPDRFNASVIEAFSQNAVNGEASTGSIARMGELKQEKFLVLTASSYTQPSSSISVGNTEFFFGAFTGGLLEALGCTYPNGSYTGSMPGDANSDSRITLKEAYDYVAYVMTRDHFSQRTQYYGDGNTVLFRR